MSVEGDFGVRNGTYLQGKSGFGGDAAFTGQVVFVNNTRFDKSIGFGHTGAELTFSTYDATGGSGSGGSGSGGSGSGLPRRMAGHDMGGSGSGTDDGMGGSGSGDGSGSGHSHQQSERLSIAVHGHRSITFLETGGALHGQWVSDEMIMSSDKKLKSGIRNLEDYSFAISKCDGQKCSAPAAARGRRSTRSPGLGAGGMPEATGRLSPLLRELRPVAFHYSKEPDTARRVRFGFIANELEALLPEVVRQNTSPEGETFKGVVYQDLIALLFAGVREHEERLDKIESVRESADREESAQDEDGDTSSKDLRLAVQALQAQVRKHEAEQQALRAEVQRLSRIEMRLSQQQAVKEASYDQERAAAKAAAARLPFVPLKPADLPSAKRRRNCCNELM
eukprot:gnl/TRDRNA2_/TRDRNA2_156197_c1_seq1.p1 gnl/TRDRNA2_/TRDRNA2_156197_c1~~gnl/TRDRNA2_/TRDRNA2_156197_c1_seq1.p1  ORF type:complete len:430 (+),score=74.33 gnl/TRDRNA2_/TRDRNA2_156197_c1_seq1:114-1292(+)